MHFYCYKKVYYLNIENIERATLAILDLLGVLGSQLI
jgi:hypothetical protein